MKPMDKALWCAVGAALCWAASLAMLLLAGGCYSSSELEPATVAVDAPLPMAGAPAPVPVLEAATVAPEPEPESACTNTSESPDYFVCEVCRSINGCQGVNRRFCCNDDQLDGEHYNAECAGFCEPSSEAMVDSDGVITCVVGLELCG